MVNPLTLVPPLKSENALGIRFPRSRAAPVRPDKPRKAARPTLKVWGLGGNSTPKGFVLYSHYSTPGLLFRGGCYAKLTPNFTRPAVESGHGNESRHRAVEGEHGRSLLLVGDLGAYAPLSRHRVGGAAAR